MTGESRICGAEDGAKAFPTREAGFSLTELIASMVLTLAVLGIAIATYSSALSVREGENSRTDALTSAQAALNVMSREIGNSGYGLVDNGIILSGSGDKKLRIRANVVNNDQTTDDEGEDITFFYDEVTQSVLRYDPKVGTSGLINRISNVQFKYLDGGADPTVASNWKAAPGANTAQVNIFLTVELPDRVGQPRGEKVEYSTKITLRNAPYMLRQY